MKTLTTTLRQQIIESMTKVEHESIAGYAIRKFAGEATGKTDKEVITAAENIKSQIHDNAIVMMRILGPQYMFFKKLRLSNRRRKTVAKSALIKPIWSTKAVV